MVIRCKYCGSVGSLTERESSQIAADLDRRYSWEEQAELVFVAVCADCWHHEEDRIQEASRAGRRVRVVRASP